MSCADAGKKRVNGLAHADMPFYEADVRYWSKCFMDVKLGADRAWSYNFDVLDDNLLVRVLFITEGIGASDVEYS
jgi:hypothetical protein